MKFEEVQAFLMDETDRLQEEGKVSTPTASFIMTAPVEGYVLVYKDTMERLELMGRVIQKLYSYNDTRQGFHAVYPDIAHMDQLFVMTMMTLITGVNPMDIGKRLH